MEREAKKEGEGAGAGVGRGGGHVQGRGGGIARSHFNAAAIWHSCNVAAKEVPWGGDTGRTGAGLE